MSYAPSTLLDARRYLLRELDAKPGVERHADLEPAEVGIVGNPATHFSGYHLGWDRIRQHRGCDDYSVSESPRDRHPTNAASALDIGHFSVRRNGRQLTLRDLSLWLVAQCEAGAPDTRDIREIIYSPDGRTVRRWDRLGIRSGGDASHLFHTHVSYFRDSESRDKVALFQRFFEPEEDDMPSAEEIAEAVAMYPVGRVRDGVKIPAASHWRWAPERARRAHRELLAGQAAILAAVTGKDVQATVRAELDRAAALERDERAAERAGLAEALAAALAGTLPDLTQEQMQAAAAAAVREVLGGLDEPGDEGEV